MSNEIECFYICKFCKACYGCCGSHCEECDMEYCIYLYQAETYEEALEMCNKQFKNKKRD